MEIREADLFPNYNENLTHKRGMDRNAFSAFPFISLSFMNRVWRGGGSALGRE
jgi:hypothetical protein